MTGYQLGNAPSGGRTITGMSLAILTRLREGPAYSDALYPLGDRKAVNLALAQLQAEGMIELTRLGYEITQAGRAG